MGGGFPCAYANSERVISIEEIANATLSEYRRLPYQPKILLEPGRAIVGGAAILVSTVIARVNRGGSNWLFLDAGVYNALFEALAIQGSTRYQVISAKQGAWSRPEIYSLAGPTGDSADIVARDVILPHDIGTGDRLIFYNVGAYSVAVTSRFNGFPKPNVLFTTDEFGDKIIGGSRR